MLSEEMKKEMLEVSASMALREDFRRLRRHGASSAMDLDQFIDFLKMMGRFSPPQRKAGGAMTGVHFLI